jgi:hypothetical protein
MKNRRTFIKESAITGVGITAGLQTFGMPNSSRIMGANEKIRMGFIGVGNRGSQLLGLFMKNPICEVAALCDVY